MQPWCAAVVSYFLLLSSICPPPLWLYCCVFISASFVIVPFSHSPLPSRCKQRKRPLSLSSRRDHSVECWQPRRDRISHLRTPADEEQEGGENSQEERSWHSHQEDVREPVNAFPTHSVRNIIVHGYSCHMQFFHMLLYLFATALRQPLPSHQSKRK